MNTLDQSMPVSKRLSRLFLLFLAFAAIGGSSGARAEASGTTYCDGAGGCWYLCYPSAISSDSKGVVVRCQRDSLWATQPQRGAPAAYPGPFAGVSTDGPITLFGKSPVTDSFGAATFLSQGQLAINRGKKIWFYYRPAEMPPAAPNTISFCDPSNCRVGYAISYDKEN